ncbi:MAG: family 78 glycoside hydrolase catalytic domain [Clostridia bacterium]|nr:family 78 glycoside hydrolase catalytic domain [Clostridia bacterium]
MKQEFFFRHAKWVGAPERTAESFSVLRGHFTVGQIRSASLAVLGLGFFKCYINGQCINPDTFLPLSSDFEPSCDPRGEVLSAHRIYVPQFDITPYVREGDNVIAIHYGGGWYTFYARRFGLPKAIYCITAQTDTGEQTFVSDENCRIGDGFVTDYHFMAFEHRNLLGWGDCFSPDFDDSAWAQTCPVEPLDTDYCTTDCPRDALIEQLPVREIGRGANGGRVFDCGQNTTGYPVIEIRAGAGETVSLQFSEALLPNGEIDPRHCHHQAFSVVSDGEVRTVQPEFIWYGFRCFELIGDAEPLCVKVIHAEIPVSSSFSCDNETLNWTYRTFVHTMLCNMHTGHPSDCPHLERRGYTGDGQLTCHTALLSLDARTFYEKWMQDIADGQDTLTGHVQNTAPYLSSGGGPGGWGCAIVEVPYQLYRHFGDPAILSKYYDNMRRYIDYLELHSEFGLVTTDNGAWYLGEWCSPMVFYPDKDIGRHNQQMIIPPPLTNTYFMVKSLSTMCKIARIIGRDADIAEYEEKIAQRKRAINAAYFIPFDGNFVMNVHGANVFGLDIGLGNERTYENTVNYYTKLGCYDTGIFATDILTRLLFERGDDDLAVTLLTGDGSQGYEHWRRGGATTFHEYWDSNRSRSHSHPMFGAAVSCFFDYLLGIRQADGSAGYRSLIIEPRAVSRFGQMQGSITVPAGRISVSYVRTAERTDFTVVIPPETTAVFRYEGREIALNPGENRISV